MLKSAKSTSQDEELDDDGDFVIKKETSTANKGIICYAHTKQQFFQLSPHNKTFRNVFVGGLRIKVDGNSSDQKANTPRSKHSATEQRRRSKINDRQVFLLLFNSEFVSLSVNYCCQTELLC